MRLFDLPAAFLLCYFLFFSAYADAQEDLNQIKVELTQALGNQKPRYWGERVPGVKTRLNTQQKIVALTLDACGSYGDGYDSGLIDFLIKEKIPATLFINGRWISKNLNIFKKLALNHLFEIENHGLMHMPCSVNGRSAFGVKGTRNINEIVDEVEINGRNIQALTGRKPFFYRSGTAYYDEIAVEAVRKLGYGVVGFSVLGDAGATYSRQETKNAVFNAHPGDIIICHMNHPEKQSSKGLIDALRGLKKQGFDFVKLEDCPLK